ncbi:pirin family protein [Alteromonas sp. 345S023]|uniref:Pirin family protein n=1 Tax=Alteromonas profundi TaxID=2696062 RepID=A0A7X5LPM9_9ALTE|nr:pirin family protein [Alteromonas profundi]NDV93207.1 pirin family protein [Alteromonas profundi]
MNYIRKSEQRGTVNLGWLQSRHSFSFGSYYDPNHMGVSVLRVINDDIISPAKGFGMHAHRDMEIITYVTNGALKHEDSMGNSYVVPAGDVQRMSAGQGIMHSEFNASDTDTVKLLQIWIEPNVKGTLPSYEQKTVKQKGALTSLVTPNGKEGSLSIQQNASIYRLVLAQGGSFVLHTHQGMGYLHIIKGALKLEGSDFYAGDAFAVSNGHAYEIKATKPLEALWFSLPTS